MTHELRRKIAELKGWKLVEGDDQWFWIVNPFGKKITLSEMTVKSAWESAFYQIPNWPESIADAWELESEIATLEDGTKYVHPTRDYTFQLIKVLGYEIHWGGDGNYLLPESALFELAHATPEQRCRAYIAWKEAQS